MKITKRIWGALLTLCIAASLIPTAVFAAAPAVPYADWNGKTAVWARPQGNYQRIRYHINVVKLTSATGGNLVHSDTTQSTYYDLSSVIAKEGSGKYFYNVQSETGIVIGDPDSVTAMVSWNDDASEATQSFYLYDTSVKAPANLQWSNNVAVWAATGTTWYGFRLYRNGRELSNFGTDISFPGAAEGQLLGWIGGDNRFDGIMANYGGTYTFKVRSISDEGGVGEWVTSPASSITLTSVDGINIENASLDVVAGQTPAFTGSVADADKNYYRIVEGWQDSGGKMITSDETMNAKITNKITEFEEGVTYNYFVIVTAYSGYMVSDNSAVTLNGKKLGYSITDSAADGDAMAGLPIDGGFHQAQLNNLYSAAAASPYIKITDTSISSSSVSVTASWSSGEASPVVYAVAYDINDVIVSIKRVTNLQSTGTQTITLPIDGNLDTPALIVKVFLWEDISSINPLALEDGTIFF